ncbi:MAG: Glucose/sorbosone dehydrogenase-like protein [Flavisolibacter sp.]|jgi:glucose/arabinose dehydrogenase|nr:Glucose/sorbosone dehydrogenase-like protein [Flavisolibacter sp.]
MKNLYALLLLTGSIFFAVKPFAQPSVTYDSLITGLSAPVEVVNAADGSNRLFIVQQDGVIRVYDAANGGLQAAPFLNISSTVTYGGERGLLSAAFHPAYEVNGYFFVYYNNLGGDVTIARYHANGLSNVAEAGSGVVFLTIPKPFDNHNGGHLQFAKDSTLFFATGDGGSGNDPFNNAQDSTSLLGKMIRIDVSNFTTPPYYTIPTSNPFYNTPNFDKRIWARGLRNPYRWSFDRLTGDMWIGDVGQGAKEEVNFRSAASAGGENYGWRCYEGSIRTPGIDAATCNPLNYFPPLFDYNNPASGSSSVVGGYVYRGTEYPFFVGYYIAADVYSGNIYLVKQNDNGSFPLPTVRTGLQNFVVGFGEGEDGTLYAVSQATNVVYKVVASIITLPVTLSSFTGKKIANANELRWITASEQNTAKFILEFSDDGNRYVTAGEVIASGNNGGTSYSFTHAVTSSTALFYRLRIVERDGSSSYSSIVKINGKENGYQVYPTIVRHGKLYINTNRIINSIQVVTSNGNLVFQKNTFTGAGLQTIQLPSLAKGMYVVRIIGKEIASEKIVID